MFADFPQLTRPIGAPRAPSFTRASPFKFSRSFEHVEVELDCHPAPECSGPSIPSAHKRACLHTCARVRVCLYRQSALRSCICTPTFRQRGQCACCQILSVFDVGKTNAFLKTMEM